MTTEPPHKPRKAPRQARAKATVEAILEATAHILVDEGVERLSTNHVAEVAGVSIGSLYQYFPNKEALVLALLERHVSRMLGLLSQHATDLIGAPIDQAVATYVRVILQTHRIAPRLHHVLTLQAVHLDLGALAEWEAQARGVVQRYLETRKDDIVPDDPEMAAFVLVHSVEAVIHRAILKEEDVETIPWERLAKELEALLLRYLLSETPVSGA